MSARRRPRATSRTSERGLGRGMSWAAWYTCRRQRVVGHSVTRRRSTAAAPVARGSSVPLGADDRGEPGRSQLEGQVVRCGSRSPLRPRPGVACAARRAARRRRPYGLADPRAALAAARRCRTTRPPGSGGCRPPRPRRRPRRRVGDEALGLSSRIDRAGEAHLGEDREVGSPAGRASMQQLAGGPRGSPSGRPSRR